jgi:hypothetical protein
MKDRPFGHAQAINDVLYRRLLVALFREQPRGDLYDFIDRLLRIILPRHGAFLLSDNPKSQVPTGGT